MQSRVGGQDSFPPLATSASLRPLRVSQRFFSPDRSKAPACALGFSHRDSSTLSWSFKQHCHRPRATSTLPLMSFRPHTIDEFSFAFHVLFLLFSLAFSFGMRHCAIIQRPTHPAFVYFRNLFMMPPAFDAAACWGSFAD